MTFSITIGKPSEEKLALIRGLCDALSAAKSHNGQNEGWKEALAEEVVNIMFALTMLQKAGCILSESIVGPCLCPYDATTQGLVPRKELFAIREYLGTVVWNHYLQNPGENPENKREDVLQYDPVNYSLTWLRSNGERVYGVLNTAQQAAFQILFAAWKDGKPDVSTITLSQKTGVNDFANVWRHKEAGKTISSPFWKTLVIQQRRRSGTYRLDPLEELHRPGKRIPNGA